MRILLDVDGCIIDFVSAYLQIVNSLYRRNHTVEDVTEWAIETSLGLTEEQAETVSSYIRTRGFASNLLPYPGAVEGVAALRAAGHSVYFVTTPYRGLEHHHVSWAADREHSLIRLFGAAPGDVVHTSAKHLVQGDVFIDDNVTNVQSWERSNPNGFALLWAQPYNWVGDLGDGAPMVCHGWDHLTELLRLLERGRE